MLLAPYTRIRTRVAREIGQTTAEYALARSSGKLPAFFDNIIDQVAGSAQ